MMTRIFKLSVLCWALACLLVTLAHAQTELPWATGDVIAPDWTITQIERHAEFVRLYIQGGQGDQVVEITPKKDDSPWSGKRYRVQPGPGSSPPESLLKAVLEQLKTWEAAQPASDFVKTVRREPPPVDAPFVAGLKAALASPGVYTLLALLLVALYLAPLVLLLRVLARRFFRLRPVIYWAIALTPLALALIVLGAFGLRIVQMNRADADELVAALDARLTVKTGQPMQFVERDGQPGYLNPYSWYNDSEDIFVPFAPATDEAAIYVFGGSSVGEPGQPETFAAKLGEFLAQSPKLRATVYNLGMNGYDSYSIRNRLTSVLERRPPQLVILYSGHNDYIDQYFYLKNSFALIRQSAIMEAALKTFFIAVYRPLNRLIDAQHFDRYEAFRDYLLEPRLGRAVFESGLVRLDPELFTRANEVILRHFRDNLETMLTECRKRQAPVLIVTPIANLEAEPSGADARAETLFKQGMAARDYAERIRLLIEARDLDVFAFMIRVKSPLVDYLRQLDRREGVSVLDLQARLEEERFPFSYENFADYLHLTPATHARIAVLLYETIKNRKLCCEIPKAETNPEAP
jgi:lysophospholipase L1-like esterase